MLTRRILALAFLLAACLAAGPASAASPLAVFSLHPLNMEAVGDDAEVYYALTQALSQGRSVTIMPRRELEEKLRVAGLAQARNQRDAQAAGRVLGVRYVLYGDVEREGSRISTEIHLLDVPSGKLVKTWNTMFTGYKSIMAGCANLAEEIVRAMESGLPETVAAPQPARTIAIDNFAAASKGEDVLLTWRFNPKDPIVGFTISRSGSPDGPFSYLGKSKKNSFTDSTARQGASYYYRLGLNLADGSTRQHSKLANIKDVGEKLPFPPLVLGGKGLIRRAEIEFAPSLQNMQNGFKIKAYRLYRRKPGAADFELVSDIRPEKGKSLALRVTEKDLKDGQTLEYVLTSLDSRGKESPTSEAITVDVPAVPSLKLAEDNLLRQVKLEWIPQQGVQGYYLYRKGPVGPWQRVAKVAQPQVSTHTDVSDLDDGLDYAYYLTAYDAQGETGPSGEVKARTKPVPEPPTDLKAESGGILSVELTWTANPDPDVGGYEIFRGPSPKSMEKTATVKGYASSSHLDKGNPPFDTLEHGATYHYAIRAVNLRGAPGKVSHSVEATTKPRPIKPKGLKADTSGARVVVRWDKNPEPDIKSYVLSRSWIEGFWNDLATIPPGTNVYMDKDVEPGRTYTYRLTAVDKDGLSSDQAESGKVDIAEEAK